VKRHDATIDHFSYHRCIDGVDGASFSLLVKACRQLISEQMFRGRHEHFKKHADEDGYLECELSGQRMREREAQIDHMPPLTFPVIVWSFFWAVGLDPRKLAVRHGRANELGIFLPSRKLEKRFLRYHAMVTRGYLRIVDGDVHARTSRSNDLKRAKLPVFLKARTDG
jgi:hypothetical protein